MSKLKQPLTPFYAALYCRISSEDRDGSSNSIETQKIKLVSFAEQKNLSVFDIYCDDAVIIGLR